MALQIGKAGRGKLAAFKLSIHKIRVGFSDGRASEIQDDRVVGQLAHSRHLKQKDLLFWLGSRSRARLLSKEKQVAVADQV